MIARVIPRLRLARHLTFYDYRVPESLGRDLRVGTVLRVPFRGRSVMGVVWELPASIEHNKPLQPIQEFVDWPTLPDGYLQFLRWFWEYHAIAPGHALKTALPQVPRMDNRSRPTPPRLAGWDDTSISIKIQAPNALTVDPPSLDFAPCVYRCDSSSARLSFLRMWITSQQAIPVLCITPTVHDAMSIFGILSQQQRASAAIVHAGLRDVELASIARAFLRGSLRLLIGTKRAAFLPVPANTQILWDIAESRHHDQPDQNPRYAIADVLLKRSEIEKLPLFATVYSRPFSFFRRRIRTQRVADQRERNASVTWIPMLTQAGYPISNMLSDAVNERLERGPVFLLFNKDSERQRLECKQCHASPRCTVCQSPLVLEHDALLTNGWCGRCMQSRAIPTLCASCHSSAIIRRGMTSSQIRKELEQQFPSRRVAILTKTAQDSTYNADIIVGTEFALTRIPLHRLSMIGVLVADQFFRDHEITSTLHGIHLLSEVLATAKGFPSIQVHLQYYELSEQIRNTLSGDVLTEQTLLASHEAERKEFGYPPFGNLVRLLGPLNSLETLAGALNSLGTVLGPVRLRKDRFEIRIKSSTSLPEAFLRELPDDVLLDRTIGAV